MQLNVYQQRREVLVRRVVRRRCGWCFSILPSQYKVKLDRYGRHEYTGERCDNCGRLV